MHSDSVCVRTFFRLLGFALVGVALAGSILVGVDRPFTAYGQGSAPRPPVLHAFETRTGQLLRTLATVPGVSVAQQRYLGYNQGDVVRGLSLCRKQSEGVYSFTGQLRLPAAGDEKSLLAAVNTRLTAYTRAAAAEGLQVSLRGGTDLRAGRRVVFAGSNGGSVLLNYTGHTIYLSGSVPGCYPLSQLPRTVAASLAGVQNGK